MYGKVSQVGFVVEDMEKAIKDYSSLFGIKRWYRTVSRETELIYRGRAVNSKVDYVMGYCGSNQIELIATKGDKNFYNEFLDAGRAGLHHVCFFVNDLQNKIKYYESIGYKLVQRGKLVGRGSVTHFVYLVEEGDDTVLELAETRMKNIVVNMTPFIMKIGAKTGELKKI